MDYIEASAWLRGERSSINTIPPDPSETWLVRVAGADAASTQQAYWVTKAHQEGLIEATIAAQAAELERLRGIVDRLPKTADGVPVTCGDEVFAAGQIHMRRLGDVGFDLTLTLKQQAPRGATMHVVSYEDAEYCVESCSAFHVISTEGVVTDFFSTREAAEAAAAGEGGG